MPTLAASTTPSAPDVAFGGPELVIAESAYQAMIGAAYDGLPDEACGLLVGTFQPPTVPRFATARNAAASSRLYTVDSKDHFRALRDAEDEGLDIVGVMHSHTHTEAYPSPTDVAQAPDPDWHYIIVSLRQESPVLRSYRIIDGGIFEEPVVVVAG